VRAFYSVIRPFSWRAGFLILSKENMVDLLIGKGKIYLIEAWVFVKKILFTDSNTIFNAV
jgi:hypothetical protein